MELEVVILSKLTQEQKTKHHMFSLIINKSSEKLPNYQIKARAMAHVCNHSNLGGQGRQITGSQEFETSLANM
ncbi:hypothetical protein AAY473_014951, partial [Plecturocebus cupreus]